MDSQKTDDFDAPSMIGEHIVPVYGNDDIPRDGEHNIPTSEGDIQPSMDDIMISYES